MGAGSGILSIGALLLGAKNAVGIDIDENSVRIAKENAAQNNIETSFEAMCGNIIDDVDLREKIGTDYDVVVAKEATDSFTEEDYVNGLAYLKTCYGADAYTNEELIAAF